VAATGAQIRTPDPRNRNLNTARLIQLCYQTLTPRKKSERKPQLGSASRPDRLALRCHRESRVLIAEADAAGGSRAALLDGCERTIAAARAVLQYAPRIDRRGLRGGGWRGRNGECDSRKDRKRKNSDPHVRLL
jgi:hypothetical protein